MKLAAAALVLIVFAACSREDEAPPELVTITAATATPGAVPPPARTEAPAGSYELDRSHTSLTLRVDHLGLSRYTARFTGLDGRLAFDPARPEASQVTITVDAKSLETDYPDPALDFDAQLTGPEWLDAARYPTIEYRSTRIQRTGADTARITGELTLHGVTRPIVLEARFNGGYAAVPGDPSGASRIGFSAQGTLKRSQYGISYGVPAPGTSLGVGDDIEVMIESEFVRQAAGPAAPSPGAAAR